MCYESNTAEVERRGLLTENQLGTVRMVQGAKEQALLNIALNKAYGNELKTTWVDVKKAFDSISYDYLHKCVEKLNLPGWILTFLKSITTKWVVDVRNSKEKLLEKLVCRGILQADSLSPLLFVLCMDPLSRKLNGKYPKIEVNCGDASHTCNHLLFADDLKLLATSHGELKLLLDEAFSFFKVVGLEVNREKSATNSKYCSDRALLLENSKGYKYLVIIEDKRNVPPESR